MKKLTALLLASSMLLTAALTGCGDSDDGGDSKKSEIKSIVYVTSNLGDKSFADISWKGVQEAGEELDIDVKVIEYGTDSKSKMEPTLMDAADTYDLVLFSQGEMLEILEKHAEEYPTKRFIAYDIDPNYDNKLSNCFCINYVQSEGEYLAGALAMKMSQSKVIGFVGGADGVLIGDFMVGYIQGAQSVEPSGKVAVSFIGNYTDAPKAKELSNVQINTNKADVVHQVAAGAGLGVFQACQDAGCWALGVDADQREYFIDSDPELAKVILTSMTKRNDIALKEAITLAVKGELPFGTLEKWGVKKGVVALAENDYYKEQVPADVQTYIDEQRQKIADGEIKVQSAYGMEQEELNSIRNNAKP
ncbi:BMP family ABC transporter substrate-binding protein [Neobittarella massiliensis]|uniref:BMP family ABC transporter substrate-binding protein n=1 Tax=Neobittarella massiliensis (ex Bilen et al. 2018) TaxID=2041842 RepID=UPI000CF6F64F|nr:BMP family ABC transporter substrate-binding protein [Neobittarella massiliensis]